MTRVLVLGRGGQLARALAQAAWPEGWESEYAGRADIDLARPEQAARAVQSRRPDLVVNAAAYTAVDKAESEPELAMRINAEAPGAIARACAMRGMPFVTISTDYVFDGSKAGAYAEDDAINPVSAYGRSKAQGEAAARAANARHLILRTSWVFSATGSNFVRTMLRLAGERDQVSVVADQRGRPTAAADLGDAIIAASQALLQNEGVAGTYHVANAGPTTWHHFASAIFTKAARHGLRAPQLTPISTADYPTPARRPANSVLATEKFERVFGAAFRPWHEPLGEVVDDLLSQTRTAV